MKKLLFSLLSLLCLSLSALQKDLVLRFDFDTPAAIGGTSLDLQLPPTGTVPGKFGNGYHFQRSSFNFLPPEMAKPASAEFFQSLPGSKLAFLTVGKDKLLQVTGKGFSSKKIPVQLWNRRSFFTYPETALTYSVWVKGEKGSKITLELAFVPETLPEKQIKAALDKFAKNKLINKDPAYADKLRSDTIGKQTFILNGEWQRFAVVVRTDVRTLQIRKHQAVIKAENHSDKPLLFKEMQLEHTLVYPYNTEAPTGFLPGNSARPVLESGIRLSMDSIRKIFPKKQGTVSFFVKVPTETNLKSSYFGLFCFGVGWRKPLWCMDGNRIVAGAPQTLYFRQETFSKWTHVAISWDESKFIYYVDGVRKGESKRTFTDFSTDGYLFCVGKNLWSERSADAILDEFLVFSRTLKPDEIKQLATANKPISASLKNKSLNVLPFSVPVFYRNDPDAGITVEVVSDKAQEVSLFTITDFWNGHEKVLLKPGKNQVRFKMYPALKTPGSGPLKLYIEAKGQNLFSYTGTYQIRGALRKDLIRFISWGGEGAVPFEYEKKLGINARNGSAAKAAEIIDQGMLLSLDLRNHRELVRNNFDTKKTAADVVSEIRDLRDSFAWYSTMLNSESVGSWRFADWKKYPVLMKYAENALGFAPPVAKAKINPDMCLDHKEMQFDGNGVYQPGKAWKMLYWYRQKGDMIYALNRDTGKVVKQLKPDNLLWTDPAYPGLFDSVDMGSDWAYTVSLMDVAGRLRHGWSWAQVYGKKYQPTLTMYYWTNSQEKATLNGKTYFMPRSVDGLIANSWVAAGVAPMHDLCFFNTYGWYDAETSAKTYLPMKGMAETYGKFVREIFYPAALLLRDTAEPQAKVALFLPEDITYYSEHDWNGFRVRTQWLRALSQNNIHFDVVSREKFLKDGLGAYHTIIVPMRSAASKEVHEALIKASKHAKIVVDDYCTATYPNMVKLNYRWNGYDLERFAVCNDFVKELAKQNTGRRFKAVGEKGPVMYFERLHNGVRYFLVINNLWSADGYLGKHSVLRRIQGIDFKPHGVRQKVKLSFEPDRNSVSAIYDFKDASKIRPYPKDRLWHFDFELAPGEGRLFCVYPDRPISLNVKAPSIAKAGSTLYLECSLWGVPRKKITAGRQIIELKLYDGAGKLTDESGYYVMENGVLKIPVRIALDSKPGIWRAELRERTTGLRNSCRFKLP
ncbi:MAG: LamG domain-containing protein [Lentisphaerae bacterium]|nr:LamG domain-containing protein [Lentisphaerota bacterium]